MDAEIKKRKVDPDTNQNTPVKKPKAKREWTTPKRREANEASIRREIQAGDAGIWVSCSLGKEGRVVGDLKARFEEHAQVLVGPTQPAAGEAGDRSRDADLEAEIEEELQDMRKPPSEPLFTSVRIDTQCLLFFKTQPPVDPVAFVRSFCEDVRRNPDQPGIRYVKRLTPMTAMGKATESGIRDVAQQVLAPHFHVAGSSEKKFAIRPNIRHHSVLKRDWIIKQVAQIVGPGHKVDLEEYDLLILVQIYRNICGMSVVGSDFDTTMRRFNIDELSNSTPK